MKALWASPEPAIELVVVDDTIVVVGMHRVVALDHHGKERWRRTFERQPKGLTRCGRGVAFSLPEHVSATQVVALDLDGNQVWQYARNWGLHFRGITGDRDGLVLYGQDYGPVADDHWVGLGAATGQCVFDVRPPADAGPMIAGGWLIAAIDDGSGGLIRSDRHGRNPTPLTSLSHVAVGTNDELVLLNTSDTSGPSEIVAIELASGHERWRAPGGNNLEIELHDGRAAWVEGSATKGRPVVYDLATGAQIWSGASLPPINDGDAFYCKLGPDAVVCYCGFENVVFYSLATASPIHSRAREDDEARASRFWGKRFLEVGREVRCWELP